MSKMPAKKKSCFQITSVTQAQVAASTAADDTESLDGDPDDSRAEEDGSSEIFDVGTGRASDYEPAACAGDHRGSSEEGALTFNNVGDQPPLEPPPQTQTHVPQQQGGQLPSGNPNGTFRIVAVQPGPAHPGAAQPGAVVQPQPALTAGGGGGPAGVSASTSQPVPAAATGSTHSSTTTTTTTTTSTTVSCSSRFRVIKLDHGTGEPFRRGRWTCTEFYEKDSDGSIVSRTVDSIRHASATLVDPSIDRDSGLGQTGGSVATHSGQGSIVDTSSLSASRMLSADALQQQHQQQQMHHQTYSVVKQGGSGTATQNAFAQQQQPAAVGLQPSNAQTLLPIGHNGLPQGGVHLQKSPGMPPAGQPVSYPPQQQQQMLQQVPTAHHLTGQSPGLLMNQTEYYQQPQPAAQTLPATSLPAGAQQGGQGPSPVMTQAASMQGQVGEMAGAPGGTLPLGHLQQMQHIGGGMLGVGGSASQHMSVGQYVASGQPHGLHSAPSGVQNVPVVVAASPGVPTSMPAAVPSASSAVMPNSTSSPLPVGQQSLMPQSNMVAPGGLPMAGFVPGEAGSGRRLDGLASPQPPIAYGKDLMKPLIHESLQLATPTVVNSLFGISIPVDGDEDRNPSKAFYQAFQPGSRPRDSSKALSDSASGTSVVAIDNKIEQAMDLVKSHLMYAVREEVEVLKEQIKELFERNSLLERENAVLKSLANSEQLSQVQSVQSTATGGAVAVAAAAAAPPPSASAVTPPQQQQGLILQSQANTTQQQQQQQQQQLQLQQQQLQQQQQQQQPTPPPPQVQVQPQPHSNDPSKGQQQQQPPLPQPSVTSA